ncbi:uncharacterized protein PF3D7_1120000-like [Cardiocondyla obscurior]|uniref:uncharacterized protein PF3D7_1120000-like n=1 Tax=Cardiocondyla obscurior TaxID=286306 RepID=UPI00396572DC
MDIKHLKKKQKVDSIVDENHNKENKNINSGSQCHEYDFGNFVEKDGISDEFKLKLHTDSWMPNKQYSFKQDSIYKKKLKEVNNNKKEIKKCIEDLRKEWEREKQMLIRKIEGLEKRVKKREKKEMKKLIGGETGVDKDLGKNKQVEKKERVKVIKLQERVRLLEIKKRKEKKEVEKLVKEMGVNVRVEKVRKIGRVHKGGFGMVQIRFDSFKEKLEVIKEKGKLKDRKEWISDDLTVYERKVEWKIKVIAEKLKKERKKVKIGYMKL